MQKGDLVKREDNGCIGIIIGTSGDDAEVLLGDGQEGLNKNIEVCSITVLWEGD